MPFLKSITDERGLLSSYWVVANATIEPALEHVNAVVFGYADQAAYEEGLQHPGIWNHRTGSRASVSFKIPFAAFSDTPCVTKTLNNGELERAITNIWN